MGNQGKLSNRVFQPTESNLVSQLTSREKNVGLILMDLVLMWCKKNKLSFKKVKRRTHFKYELLGQVRSKILNDGTVFSCFLNYFKLIKCNNSKTLSDILCKFEPEELSKLISYINNFVKTKLVDILATSLWVQIVDLGNIVGYPKPSQRIFKQNIKQWLVEDKDFKMLADKKEILRLIYKVLGPVQRGNKLYHRYKKFDDFLVARYTWMNQGATNYSNLEFDGQKIRTKMGFALSATDDQLRKACSEENILRDKLKTFVKNDEKGLKGRYVVNAPFGMYATQKFFIDYLVDNTPGKLPKFGMFLGTEKIKSIQLGLNNNIYHIPLDFDAFDTNVSGQFFEAFYDYCELELDGEFLDMARFNRSLFGKVHVLDQNGQDVGCWTRGLPSGLYPTAFLGSLFNLVAQCKIEEESFGVFKAGLGQGDDVDLIYDGSLSDDSVLSTLASLFESFFGFKVNVTKNWYSREQTEFLKMIITKEEVFQYPARVYSSLCWHYPTRNPSSISDKLNNLASLWKEFFDRLGYIDEKMIIQDIFQAVRNVKHFSKNMVEEWLHTCPYFGGFGLLPVRLNYIFKYKTTAMKRRKVNNLLFSRYPLHTSLADRVVVTPITQNMVLSPNVKYDIPKTMFEIFGTKPLTFREYIEYFRYISGLSTYLTTKRLKIRKDATDMLFRVHGYSDYYLNHLINFKQIFFDDKPSLFHVIRLLLLYQPQLVLAGMTFHSMLWK